MLKLSWVEVSREWFLDQYISYISIFVDVTDPVNYRRGQRKENVKEYYLTDNLISYFNYVVYNSLFNCNTQKERVTVNYSVTNRV